MQEWEFPKHWKNKYKCLLNFTQTFLLVLGTYKRQCDLKKQTLSPVKNQKIFFLTTLTLVFIDFNYILALEFLSSKNLNFIHAWHA